MYKKGGLLGVASAREKVGELNGGNGCASPTYIAYGVRALKYEKRNAPDAAK